MTIVRAALVLVTCAWVVGITSASTAEGGDQARHRWWLTPAIQRQLALTPVQVQALQTTFEREWPERVALRHELERLEAQLQQLFDRGETSDALVERVSVKLEEVRARRNVRRTLILLRMYRLLTPAQRLALSRLQSRDDAAPSH